MLHANHPAQFLLFAHRNPLNKIPGPLLAKYTNLPSKLAVVTGREVHYIDSLHKKYGPYVRTAPGKVAVNDPRGAKQIHAIGSGFEKTDWYEDVSVFPRPVLFTMRQAKTHAARRRLFARGFSKSNIRQNWEGVVRERIVLAVDKMKSESARSGCADALKWWTLMASDVSSHLMFGESFHTLERGEVNDYIRTLTKALMGGGIGAELPLVRAIGKRLPIRAAKELFDTGAMLQGHAETAVRNMKASQESRNIFAHIATEAEKGEALDDADVLWEAIALFVAGTDTTAISLTYLTWAVLSRPELRKRLEEEVATLPANYTDADTERLPLLNAVIEETLRLYGAAPGALPRVVPSGGVEMGGFFLPEDTVVSTHAFSMHRLESLFPDPLVFKPERWMPGSKDAVSDAAKAAFSPFGSGSKGCLGVHIAYSELRLGAAEFFRQCTGSRLAESTTVESMDMENFFLIAPKSHRCEIVVGQ